MFELRYSLQLSAFYKQGKFITATKFCQAKTKPPVQLAACAGGFRFDENMSDMLMLLGVHFNADNLSQPLNFVNLSARIA